MASAAVVFSAPERAPAQARLPAAVWQAPVPGDLSRRFKAAADPFAPGAHRGIDLTAPVGTRVGATCTGRVAFAGAVAGSRVVTLACGPWRVTHLPLRDVLVATGDRVRRGERLGTATAGSGSGHAGLHVGVRRAGNRFGYVDPWPLLTSAAGDHPGPVARPLRRGPRGARHPAPRPPARTLREPRTAGPRVRPRPVTGAPARVPLAFEPAGRPASEGGPPRLAPALAWVGLAVLLLGVARARPRRHPKRIWLRSKEPATRTR